MILHLAHSGLAAIMTSAQPDVLKARQLDEMEKLANESGIRFVANDLSTMQVQADVSQSSPDKLFAYLEHIGCQAVDVEVPDLACWSKGVECFAIQKYYGAKCNNLAEAESKESLKASLRGLPVDQVHDTVMRVLLKATVAPPQTNMTEAEILKDLTDAGYLQPDSASRLDRDPDAEREKQLMRGWEGSKRPVGWAYNPQFDGPLDESII